MMSVHRAVAWMCGALSQGRFELVGCIVTMRGIEPSDPDAWTMAFRAC